MTKPGPALRGLAFATLVGLLLARNARATGVRSIPSFFVERPESDVLLLAVKLDQSVLADALPVYEEHGALLLPLGELSRLLGLGITTDAARGGASGFFIDERRLFDLDVVAGRVLVEGKPKRFDPAGIEVHREEIFVDAALLSEWLPLRLDIDRYAAVLTVRPREGLPLQARLERERRVGRSHLGATATPVLPRAAVPYALADGPFIDQSLQLSRVPDPGGGGRNALDYATYVTGDLLYAEASAYVSGNEHAVTDSRFSLGRKDPDAGLLGPLEAREVTLGDVFHPGLDLIALPSSGPGVLVSSFPLLLPSQFDRQTFRGDLPPGWEVELYRGDELLAYARSRPDGLYEFLDVPILFGLNSFRVEMYGPQGQRHTETRPLNVGQTLTPAGQLYYRLAGDDPGARLVGTGLADVHSRASFEASYGLAHNLSASAAVASVDLVDGRRTYGKAGVRGFWGFLFANVDVAADTTGGSAARGTVQSRLGAFGLQLQYAFLDRFVSEYFISSPGPLRSRAALRLDTAIPASLLPRIPIYFELRQDRLESGHTVTDLSGRTSAFWRGLSVANQLRWSFSDGNALGPPVGSGELLVNKYVGRYALRGEVDYQLQPPRAVTLVALTGEARVARGILLSAGVTRLTQGAQTRYQVGASRLEGAVGVTATVYTSSPGGFGGSLLISVGVGRDAGSGRWHAQARPMAGSGAVSGRAFLDANGNGLLDPGETPIEGAGFLTNGAQGYARTDAKGRVFLPNLPPGQGLDLALSTSTLEDPFWRPANDGVRFAPRPGKVVRLDFPVVVSGEITGTVYARSDGKSNAASNVELELVDSNGAVVKSARSAYDGFYDMTDIRPGSYTLRVATEKDARLRRPGGPGPRAVTMAPTGTVLDGVDFVLDDRPPAAAR